MPDPSRPADAASRAPRFLLLNAIFPGLGHLAAGSRRWALVLALPLLVLIGVLVLVALGTSPTTLAARLFDPAVLTLLLVLEVAVLVWRLFALAATRTVAPIRREPATIVAVGVSLLLVIAPNLYVAGVTADARTAASAVFAPVAEGGAWVPDATPPPVEANDPDFALDPEDSIAPSPSASESTAPSATPAVPRVNVLLIGMDSGVGRNTALTDTMIVASLDPVGKTVSMASIPRDMVDVPLPDGRKFRGKINSLVSYARWHPGKFPGAKDPQSVLTAAIGTLLGIKIDSWAQVDLGGFVDLVDSVGGVNVTVTDGMCDPRYKEYGIRGFSISPGRYHFDGQHALAYARIRKALGESDFTRAGRQQEVIAALRDRLVRGGFLDNPSRFLRSLGQTIKTNIKPSLIADYIDVASGVGRKDTYRLVIDHPLVRSGFDTRGSIQVPQVSRIRAKAAKLFTPTGVRPRASTRCRSRATARSRPPRRPRRAGSSSRRRRRRGRPPSRRRSRRRPRPSRPRSRPRIRRPRRSPRPRPSSPRPAADGRMAGRFVIEVPDPSLVVLVGAAGSGKSTFAARHFDPGEVLSSDALRAAIAGDPADQAATRPAFAALHRALARRLAAGRLTVVDATSVARPARHALLRRARIAGVPAVAIVFDLPAGLVLAQNRGRADRVVPDEAVRRQLDELDAALGPRGILGEGFEDVWRLVDPATVDAVEVRRVRPSTPP